MTRVGGPLACVAALVFLSCGSGGSGAPPALVDSSQENDATAARPRAKGRLVLIAAVAEKTVHDLGEPVRIRRTYENVGDAPRRVTGRDWRGRTFGEVVITSAEGSRLYRPPASHLKEVSVEPGARIENQIEVELPAAGDYVIEVPPEYVSRGGAGACVHLPVIVVASSDLRRVAEKATRLARVIETEDRSCPTCWTQAQEDLRSLGTAVVPHLRTWLREAEVPHLRAIAAKLLGGVAGGAEGVGDLVLALADPEAQVRKMCLESLGGLRQPETLDAILLLERDPDPFVRVELIETLVGFDDARVVPAMRDALTDADPFVRRWAAIHLAEHKSDASGIQVLIQALRENAAHEATLAVPALEKITGQSFGTPTMAFAQASFEAMEEASDTNAKLARRWLEWWETEGRARFGDG